MSRRFNIRAFIATGLALFALLFVVGHCTACAPATKSATYQGELVLCNQQAPTLLESVRCENEVRSRYGRPARILHTDAGGVAR